jgi:hypothetical protein
MTMASNTDNLQDLAQIKAQLSDAGALNLDEQTVGADAFQLLQALFLQNQFSLNSCRISSSDADSIQFTAVFPELLASPNIAGTFHLFCLEALEDRQPERHFVFKLELPATTELLTFLSAYRKNKASVSETPGESRGDSLMKSLAFVRQSLIFSSLDYSVETNQSVTLPDIFGNSKIKKGLNFASRAGLSSEIIPVELFQLPTEISFQSVIETSTSGLTLSLQAGIAGEFSLKSLDFKIQGIALEFSLDDFGDVYPDFILDGIFCIGNTSVKISASLDIVIKRLIVTLSQANFKLPSISDFFKLLKMDDIQQYLPGTTNKSAIFSLETLSFDIDLAQLYFNELTFALTTETKIKFIEDILEFTPYLSLRVRDPFDSEKRSVDVLLSGNWELGETLFNVSLSYPNFYLQAEMAQGQSLNTSALSKKLLPGVNLPDIVFQDLELSADFTHFEAEIDVASDWEILIANKSFALRHLTMEVEYSDGRVQVCEMNGFLTLAGMNFDVFAAYEASGWTVRGATVAGEKINLAGIINQLEDEFNKIGITNIPKNLLDIAVKDMFLEYRSETSSFNFYISLAHSVEISSKFSITEFFVRLNGQGNSISGVGIIKLNIAKVDILLESIKDNGWKFSGSTGSRQTIPIGALIEDLAEKFGKITLPSAVAGLMVENLEIMLDTEKNDFAFKCESKFRVGSTDVDIIVALSIKKDKESYNKDFSGRLKIDGLDFMLHFSENAESNFFVAAYRPDAAGKTLNVRQLINSISADAAEFIPPDLTIKVKGILFAHSKDSDTAANDQPGSQDTTTGTASKFVFGFDIGASVNLSNLPLVGKEFPSGATVSVEDLQVLFISQGLTKKKINSFNDLLIQAQITNLHIPSPQSATQTAGSANSSESLAIVLEKGFYLSAKMNFGGSTQILTLPVAANAGSPAQAIPVSQNTPPAPVAGSASGGAKWFNLQKNFGPVYFERIGVQYQNAELLFLLDAALSFAGLTLSLEGLSVSSKLDKFSPEFNLHGLGIDYKGGAVEIGGVFLRTRVEVPGGVSYDEFDGAAILKTAQFQLSAIGSYAVLEGHPSLFIYALLDYPIGGPAFFFVTGLAAGFGYNRSLVIPPVDRLTQFPLVAEAITPPKENTSLQTNPKNYLETKLKSLRQYIPPAIGEVFLAIGIKFTSFKMIDSFALLTFSFGTRFEINLLGLSTMIVPTPIPGESPVTPLAEVQMALKATFIPKEGFLGVSAQLNSASYILSRDCHLTGGYAFYSWFSGEHEGDFVQTLGGYHPSFNIPAHYPKVPRLGFNWRVNDRLSIKGGIYYALTASTLMAGGFLQAVWNDGSLSAWFNATADFLISWKPYHYDAHIYVNVGISYSFDFFGRQTVSVDVGADLHIWGPEFSGTAHIDIDVVSFDVSFGGSLPQLKPIDWDTFKKSFLPANNLCGITVKDGLVRKSDNDKNDKSIRNIGVINPKNLSLVTNSVIPLNGVDIVNIHNKDLFVGEFDEIGQIGVGSMEVAPDNFVSTLTITIKRNNNDAESDFAFVPVKKNVPAGLWGKSLTPDLNGQSFIREALTGFEIIPNEPTKPAITADIDRGYLQYSNPKPISGAYSLAHVCGFTPLPWNDEKRKQKIKESIVNKATIDARKQLLAVLSIGADIDLSDTVSDEFLIAPMIEA